jgi:hypothetical protein
MVKRKNNTNKTSPISVPVDIIFIVDVTGSMGGFINDAKQFLVNSLTEIEHISDVLDNSYSLIVYRDHPPEDRTFASKILVNVSDAEGMKTGMKHGAFHADGGGDAPESGLDAINDISKLQLRENSIRYAFIIGDAPLHGTAYAGSRVKPCTCGLTSEKIKTVLERFNITLFAMDVRGAVQTKASFLDITPNLISITTSGSKEIGTRLEALCKNVIWSVSDVLPVLKEDKFKPLADVADVLKVSIAQVSAAIESLNMLGLTQNI